MEKEQASLYKIEKEEKCEYEKKKKMGNYPLTKEHTNL